MKIDKKVLPVYFDAILSGKKNYELRLGDFACKEGDILILREWDAKKKEYTGRQVEKEVTYVGKWKLDQLFWTEEEIKKHGLQVISLK